MMNFWKDFFNRWKRCQTHFSWNMLDKTSKKLQSDVKEDLRMIYEAVDIESERKAKPGDKKDRKKNSPRL